MHMLVYCFTELPLDLYNSFTLYLSKLYVCISKDKYLQTKTEYYSLQKVDA